MAPAVLEWKGIVNELKRNHVIAAALVALMLSCACISAAGAAALPMFKQQGDVTISREEYDRLRKY